MNKFSHATYRWVTGLRATSAGSLIALVGVLYATSHVTFDFSAAVVILAFIWMSTAPTVTMLHIAGYRFNLRLLTARKVEAPPGLESIAKELDVPIPRTVKVFKSDKPNAMTNGTVLFISTAMEPYLTTGDGRGILAHELAHVKQRHPTKSVLMLLAVGTVSMLFGARFSATHEAVVAVMSALAFLTLLAFVFPLVSRRMEYDADAMACEIVGAEAMIGALKAIVPNESRGLESDSHPSIQARIQRIGNSLYI